MILLEQRQRPGVESTEAMSAAVVERSERMERLRSKEQTMEPEKDIKEDELLKSIMGRLTAAAAAEEAAAAAAAAAAEGELEEAEAEAAAAAAAEEEDRSALVYEKEIIERIIRYYTDIIESLKTEPTGEGEEEEEQLSLRAEISEYEEELKKLKEYSAKLDEVPEGMRDKGPNKYLASMVLKTLFSIMCEEIKSLNFMETLSDGQTGAPELLVPPIRRWVIFKRRGRKHKNY